jgi:hypothetical protein
MEELWRDDKSGCLANSHTPPSSLTPILHQFDTKVEIMDLVWTKGNVIVAGGRIG